MKIVLIIFLFFSSTLYCQNTDYDLFEIEQRNADSLILINQSKKAILHLKKAIKYKPHVTFYPYKILAELYVKQKKYSKAYKIINTSILNTGQPLNGFKNSNVLLKELPLKYWLKLEKKEKKLIVSYFSNYGNLDAFIKMEKLESKDQVFRSISYEFEKFSKEQMINFKQLNPNFLNINNNEIDKAYLVQDFININELIDIAKKYGYQKGMWLLLWHQRGNYGNKNFIWDFFKPFINSEIEKGNVTRSFWCAFDDFLSWTNTGQQIYGEFELGTVDEKNVNIMRKKVNLPLLSTEEINLININVKK